MSLENEIYIDRLEEENKRLKELVIEGDEKIFELQMEIVSLRQLLAKAEK